jgi:hypothetical protein
LRQVGPRICSGRRNSAAKDLASGVEAMKLFSSSKQ